MTHPSPRRTRALAILGVGAACAATLAVGPANADPAGDAAGRAEVVVGLEQPFRLAVQPNGTVHLSHNGGAVLMRRVRGGEFEQVASAASGGQINAVSVTPRGDVVTYSVTRGSYSSVRQIRQGRGNRLLARLDTVEASRNPDGDRTYGFYDLDDDCLAQIPSDYPARYTGAAKSNPVAVATVGSTVYVADAFANAIFAIGRTGAVRVVAVPPSPDVIVDELTAENNGLPECTIGHPYRLETVPTDIEVGPDGDLYVTTSSDLALEGRNARSGPGLGTVHRIDRATGAATPVLDGLHFVTGLGVDDNGDLYVAQLMSDTILRLRSGETQPELFKFRNEPGDVEVVRGHVWATVGVFSRDPADGRVVRWSASQESICSTRQQGPSAKGCR